MTPLQIALLPLESFYRVIVEQDVNTIIKIIDLINCTSVTAAVEKLRACDDCLKCYAADIASNGIALNII